MRGCAHTCASLSITVVPDLKSQKPLCEHSQCNLVWCMLMLFFSCLRLISDTECLCSIARSLVLEVSRHVDHQNSLETMIWVLTLELKHTSFTVGRTCGDCGSSGGQLVAGRCPGAALCGACQPPWLESTLLSCSRRQPSCKASSRAGYASCRLYHSVTDCCMLCWLASVEPCERRMQCLQYIQLHDRLVNG